MSDTQKSPDRTVKTSEKVEVILIPPVRTKDPFQLPSQLQWILTNWTWSKLKPAIRCAIAAWISAVLFLIPKVEIFMGQASFLILITSFMSPPSDPFMAVLEREILIISLVTISWAWSCLGLRLAGLARTNRNPNATFAEAVSGKYIEAAPTVIAAAFIFLGSVFLLYIRARQGPGPYLFACILGCICLDISLTTGALFPFELYSIGQAILIPLGFHSVVAVLCSIFVFPSTVSAQFTTQLQGVLTPLAEAIKLHRKLLKSPTDSDEFASTSADIIAQVLKSEGALVPLAASGRLLESDLIYSRFGPTDFRALQQIARRMAVRANGMTTFLSLIDATRDKFLVTPLPSRPGTPGANTPVRLSRAPTLEDAPSTPTESMNRISSSFSHSHHHHHHHRQSHHNHRHLLHNSFIHIPMPHSKEEPAVGVFESQRYADLEATHFGETNAAELLQQMVSRLSDCCDVLLGHGQESLAWIQTWLGAVRVGRWRFWISIKEKRQIWSVKLEEAQKLRDTINAAREEFRSKTRHLVLDPYRTAFDKGQSMDEAPPYRYLFHSYVYQYHTMRFTGMVLEMLDEIIRLEKERQTNRLWTPARHIFKWANWNIVETNHDEEDPDTIQGLEPAVLEDLGMPRRRDPDALPPGNAIEWLMSHLYRGIGGLGGGNALYAIKAGALTVIMCIPIFLKSVAPLAYENKFVWALIMAQLTLARFRGDTAFGLAARIFSTFLGGVVGMCMWYICQGNPYGFAAVCGVCLPFFLFARLYWPGPPMISIIFFVTALLVLGYSYQDRIIDLPGNPGSGFTLAWRRFVLVTVGVTAAFIFSFFPPSTTIRKYQRATLATTSTEIGAIYCAILSFAYSRDSKESEEITTSLIAIRSKLNRSAVLKANAIYEFSLRGRWPADRYAKILQLQLHIAYSLSHLFSVIEHLEPQWTRAFLRRTRFTDPSFQGDVLAVITMISTALRTGTPLPQITPCPLLDRYMLRYHGLNVVHKEDEDDFGLPRSLTIETLENEQYLMFSVALSNAFAIVSRLDMLMLAVKEIVGEQYHIHGVGAASTRIGMPLSQTLNSRLEP
ncbi:hypothetical protein C8J56DRAFT_256925 [Mycena floridula]|nr:hypothetical protein C8J56DRAFT_256925 [Mycena floridula]